MVKKAIVNSTEEGIQSINLILTSRNGSPLCIHAFGDKAKQQIRDKQQKKAVAAKEERKPAEEFEAAKYIDEQGRECAPVTALKKAIITAATAFDNLTKVALKQALFVYPTLAPNSMLVPIQGKDGSFIKGVMREDAVTIGINTRGLTYRPEYKEWFLRITIEYNPRLVSKEQLLKLVDQAGWGVGVCEGRPEKSSALGWGRFQRVEE